MATHASPFSSVDVRAHDMMDAPGRRVPLLHLAGVRVGLVLWGGLAVTDVWRATGSPAYAGTAAVVLVVGLSCLGMSTTTALSAAAVGWLVIDGFVVHRLGVLGFDGAPDAARLGILVAVAVAAARVRR